MISAVAVMDIRATTATSRSYSIDVRGDQKSAQRFLSALRMECEQKRMAWQVYRAVKREAKKAGLIPQ